VTDQFQIIWKIGNEEPDEAKSYERNSSFISSTINTTVTERTTIVCFGKPNLFNPQAPENSTIILDPRALEVSAEPPTGSLPSSMMTGAPLPVNLQNVFVSFPEGGTMNMSLSLQINNVSHSDTGQLPQYFRVELQTSDGGNTTIYSTEYRPEDVNPPMNITVYWTPGGSNVCNMTLLVQISAINDRGSSVLSNHVTVVIDCIATTPHTTLCVTGCVSGNTTTTVVTVAVCLVVSVCLVAAVFISVMFCVCWRWKNRLKTTKVPKVISDTDPPLGTPSDHNICKLSIQ